MYRIKQAEIHNEADRAIILDLHKIIFGRDAPKPALEDLDEGWWWIAWAGKEAIGFAGLVKSKSEPNGGYLIRAGVLPEHRGHRLQRRFIRVRERQAARNGWATLVSDTTTNNVSSANNLAGCGYRVYWPSIRWGLSNSIYWRKSL